MIDKAKILIVDDKEENILSLSAILDQPELELVKALNGSEALALMLEQEFAMVILDVHMPNMSGYEVAKIMGSHQRTKNIPIIFITAHEREIQNEMTGYEYGAIDFLFKPINPGVLKNKVSVFLELYNQRKSLQQMVKDKEMLVREAYHRVKNNLTMIISFINLQKASCPPDTLPILEELEVRIQSISSLHSHLHKARETDKVELESYIEFMMNNVISSISTDIVIDLVVTIPPCTVEPDTAIALGLILGELCTNSIKHAFNNEEIRERCNKISVTFVVGKTAEMIYTDNGCGMPEGFSNEGSPSLGMSIIQTLSEQLDGKLEFKNDNGCVCCLQIPTHLISKNGLPQTSI